MVSYFTTSTHIIIGSQHLHNCETITNDLILYLFCFSSVLAVIGMVAGLLLGSHDSWSSWVFCATAGIFLYVGLVDMIPELNSGHAHPYTSDAQTDSHVMEVFLQLLGMVIGALIMLLIALYEHDMKNAFL